jgi:hypothetical protein
MKCPICERPNPDYAPYCQSCGADLKDPDVLALAGAPTVTAPGAEASLASDRFLGVTAAGLADGTSLTKVAWIGGAALAATFLVPIDPDFNGLSMPWSLLGGGRTVALILPLLLGAAGIELAILGKRVPNVARAAILVAAGLAVALFSLPRVAPTDDAITAWGEAIDWISAPSKPVWLVWLGTLVAGVGVTARVLRPLDRNARWVIAGGLAVVVVALFLPMDDASPHLPFEYSIYIHDKLHKASLFDACKAGLSSDFTVRFLSLWQLALPVGLGGAVALAWRRPEGPWDTKGSGLRVLGYVLVLYVAVTALLWAFNVAGWSPPGTDANDPILQRFVRDAFAARARLTLVALGVTAWIVGGGTALYLKYAPGAAGAAGAATAPPTKSE